MRPETRREWGFLAFGAVAALLILLILGARFTLKPGSDGIAFLLDSWTGRVWTCAGGVCHSRD